MADGVGGRIFCVAGGANHGLGRCTAKRADHRPGLALLPGGEIGAALDADLGIGAIARVAETALDIRPGFGSLNLRLICNQLRRAGRLKFDAGRLCCATPSADCRCAWIAHFAGRAGPLQLYVSQFFFLHGLTPFRGRIAGRSFDCIRGLLYPWLRQWANLPDK